MINNNLNTTIIAFMEAKLLLDLPQHMFTGIITDIGRIKLLKSHPDGDTELTIVTSYNADSIAIGASIACSGVCLTVTEKGKMAGGESEHDKSWFSVTVSQETLNRTLIGDWQIGDTINLERALVQGDEMGGHIVKGHVDGLAKIHAIESIGDSYKISVIIPKKYKGYVAEKGSISLNGVSLTVNEVNGNLFYVNLIPHTWEFTTLKNLKAEDKLHFEIDILVRYALKLAKAGHFNELLKQIET